MTIAIILGFLQGTTEWLPVSSEGVVAFVGSFFFERSLSEAVAFALWLHLGTVISALVVLRSDVIGLVREALTSPRRPSPLLSFMVVSTLVSAAVGFPLLLTLDKISIQFGAVAMGIIGLMMFITGGLQLRRKEDGTRKREELSYKDALLAGIAQGFAALPGLSRSGLTVSVLLARQIDRREALVLSFLMSIPASLGAGIYIYLKDEGGALATSSALVAMAVAAAVGLVTIRILLVVVERVNFAKLVITIGALMIAGAVLQAFS